MRISDWSSDVGSSDLAAARARTAIGGDPVAELGIAAYEASACAGCVIPLVVPFAVYEKSHVDSLSLRRRVRAPCLWRHPTQGRMPCSTFTTYPAIEIGRAHV